MAIAKMMPMIVMMHHKSFYQGEILCILDLSA